MFKTIDFLTKNDLAVRGSFENISASEKGLRLLDYLGIKYDFESSLRYSQVYRSLPNHLKDVIRLKINKDEIGYDIIELQWVHTIIIPIFFNDKTPVPKEVLEELRRNFIDHFGGATRFAASGDYISTISGHQEDKCEVWDGYGTEDNYEGDKSFMRRLALKSGSKDYCDQEAVTISERPGDIEIIKTENVAGLEETERLIVELREKRLFSLRSMVLLSIIASTMQNEQNIHTVYSLASPLGLE